ncbi:MAG: lysophospholipid acyltransferase family protein [Rubrivivax sp.]|uniref:lysophospholipid acyltransferase family protein n=1 Tax=Ottowia sp. TaxID=1898956 RepID=UPI00217B2CEB|nr:lysophospholipid acyltransferase family protein [Ottowia sp.]MCC6814713.1 lysophospholipid acyltransferase family protein [Rubrivivax sp.]MCZ2088400.1 lysophospholipid acyltransferase family protein [Burkholderiales bacterium]HNI86052.1 lysophospholipid acyltransferase family protein [Ottowia sp.]HNJ46227.1 lysophospholipid acyltransferase family protein [Ottowia sp.]HNK52615.1 lysophospholipid acyltransferase family protein [Ottowia sp.]
MLALYRLAARWPLSLLHALGAALGWLSWLASPTYRRRLRDNAALAGYGFAQVRPAVAHAGRMALETPRLWFGPPVPMRWDGTELVDAAYAAGRGVVFLTPHLGCFEITAQGLAERYHARYGPITVLYRPARQAALAQVVETARRREGLDTAPTTLAGVRQMIKALRAGRAVGLLPDQVPPEGQGLWSPFFGQPAYTMTLAARLIQQTGAVPLLVWGERRPRGQGYDLHFRALAEPLADELAPAVAQINREMERLIRECPTQYLWGYGRYKQPREQPA